MTVNDLLNNSQDSSAPMFRRRAFLMTLAGMGVKKKAFLLGFFKNPIQSSQEAAPLSLIEIKK